MTPHSDRFEMDLAAWVRREGDGMAPGWLHEAAMARAVGTRQRPAWLARVHGAVGSGPVLSGRRRISGVRLVIITALLAGLAAAIWLIGSRPAPVSPILNGQILVARTTGGPVAQYLTMDPDGSNERLVFEAQECGQCAFWSPDGRRLLIPEVSGERLVSAVVRVDGAAKVVLQPLPGATVNLGPGGWSPDGSLIALAGWDDTNPGRRGIYVARPDGTELRQVSRSPDGRPHDWTTFSPDGARIVFIATDADGPSAGGIAGDLMIVNLDGTLQRQLNPAGTKVVATARAGRPMDWSPDGTQIAFAAVEGDLDAGRSAVYVVPVDGGQPRRLTEPSQQTTSVDWAPSGAAILSGDTNAGTESIWTVDGSTRSRRLLWTSSADDPGCCGTWAPDGSLILFERGQPGKRDLWTMRPDGTVVGQVTHRPADYVWYSWAPADE